jgi:hypothetical protein
MAQKPKNDNQLVASSTVAIVVRTWQFQGIPRDSNREPLSQE